MRALTILQPWAHWIGAGRKFVENRTWSTKHRGWLAIHAGLSSRYAHLGGVEADGYAYGAIIAVAWVATCVPKAHIRRLVKSEPDYGWLLGYEHVEGPWCWVFGRVWPLTEPVPYRGRQSVFTLDEKTVKRIRARVAETAYEPTGSRVRVVRYGRASVSWKEPKEPAEA